MKKITALLLAGLLLSLLAACGLPFAPRSTPEPTPSAPEESAPEPEPTPSVTLRLAAAVGGEEEARWAYALERLETALPDVAVTFAAPGEAAELLLLGESEMDARAAAGDLADLAAEPSALALLEALPPALREGAVTPEGELFALPARAAETWCLFFRASRFAAAPDTPTALFEGLAGQDAPALLCPDEDEALLAFFEGVYRSYDERGLNGLFRGETSPYDEAVRQSAYALYRLGRAGAVSLTGADEALAQWETGAAALFAREGAAGALGEEARLLPWGAVRAGEGAFLAVAADAAHPSLAAAAACELCRGLAAYDLRENAGACVTLPDEAAAGTPLAQELSAYRRALTACVRLEPETAPALAEALSTGVRELLLGTMTPDEFAEIAALALDARPA